MAFRLFSVFFTVLICLNFGEVKSLDCAGWCPTKNCYQERHSEDEAACLDAKSKCDCTAASYEQLKGLINDYKKASYEQIREVINVYKADSYNDLLVLVLGVTFFVVIVGIVGCCFIYCELTRLNLGAGKPVRAVDQPTPLRGNYDYQPAGPDPPHLFYSTPTDGGQRVLTYEYPKPKESSIPPNAVP